ncbi:hypothetical protein FACS189454_08510 [Planctomycetales bacterium]|nr:hypothetical protein FACS189443_2360 [Planctomycetales bacterium]GHT46806.1 hypothetical protein FACS189454_08510 [Planctomycetales bacterium]
MFCDIHGNYFPCERVETNDALKIGDVWAGIDADKSLELINFMSDVTSCGSCAGKHLCGICPSSIAKSDAEDRKDLLIQKHCEVFVGGIKDRLAEYAWLMENGIVNFDKFIEQEPARKDWLSDVKFVVEKVE